MKKKINILVLTILICTPLIFLGNTYVYASSQQVNGSVTVGANEVTKPTDPENPGGDVDPGEGPSTTGELRIDFVSKLNFGLASTNQENRRYNCLAQLFHNETTARGYYIQVTDHRSDATGWTLKLSQQQQFSSSLIQELDQQSLEGAYLSFGNSWANSASGSTPPRVSNDTFAINEINTDYTVATAESGQGKGVWTISFGASEENEAGQKGTLTPLTNANGESVIDSTFNKQAYSNSAVFLQVPDTTKIYPVGYTTVLTWTLEAGPTQ